MAKLSEIDWNLLKFEFEVLGKSLEEIQEAYEINPAVMKYQARDWVQSGLSKHHDIKFTKLESIKDLTDEITAQVKDQSTAQLLLKQYHLLPRYIQLENILLQKSIQLASSLESSTPGAAATIRSLVNSLTDLLKHNPMLSPDMQDSGIRPEEKDREWKVTFVSPEPKNTSQVSAVSEKEEEI